jgi:hypothetical protein
VEVAGMRMIASKIVRIDTPYPLSAGSRYDILVTINISQLRAASSFLSRAANHDWHCYIRESKGLHSLKCQL